MPTDDIISLPKGGGAVSGLGEKFTADLFTGTAGLTVPIALPAGRPGATPELALSYDSGNGNGPFGLGWRLGLPGVSRRTSRGVPTYADTDVFVLAGAEDLVPVGGGRYRPRTEGAFARITHVRDASGDYWEARARNGSLTRYGTPRPEGADAAWRDPAAVADPADPRRVFGWRVTQTRDAVGNLIRYEYVRDRGEEAGHRWDQPLIGRISYVDYGDPAAPSFLVHVDFEYERRPDAFSDHRAGFEIRTALRCRAIRVTTHAADGVARVSREMRLGYAQAPFNGVSLLTRIDVVGIDGDVEEALPPETFGYSEFDPAGRRFEAVTGPGLPAAVLSDPNLALVDLRGTGLPDVVELGAHPRVWQNAGDGRFDSARRLADSPPYGLADPGVRFLDADGDGRTDLVVSTAAAGRAAAGYFPTTFAGGWDRRSFRPYRQTPSVALADPDVRLLDLDGDGLTDVLRSGSRLESWFNDADPRRAWERSTRAEGTGPLVDLSDPRVRVADMTGDGLQDIVLLRNGNVAYWPNLGHGRWGPPVVMRRAPRLPEGFDPRRVLLDDLDGDGAADLVYVDRGRILLWGNESGNGWTAEPVVVAGTPNVVDTDAVLLSDLRGTGMAGLLFSRAADGSGRHLRFLDVTGGVKPYLLQVMDNNMGAITRIAYGTSTQEYLRDRRSPATRWRTTLPFPVHVVSRVEVEDAISGGRLTTEYRYHHGYWDGVEREFRGFAMVEQFDTETFTAPVPEHHSPPTLTRSWFHPGPVASVTADDWTELDLRHEYCPVDAPMLRRTPVQDGLSRSARRDALRALRGQLLRTELYALDGTGRANRPYTVTETAIAVRQEAEGVFFPFTVASRTTQWERGDEPMHQFTFTAGHDEYGLAIGQLAVAVPRGRNPLSTVDSGVEPYLATYETIGYARHDDPDHYIVDRVARVTGREVVNDGRLDVLALRDAVLAGAPAGSGVSFRVIADGRTYFDGEEFVGLPLGTLGEHGLPVRTESLAFTDAFLDDLFAGTRPVYLNPDGILPDDLPPVDRPPDDRLTVGVVNWPAEYPPEFRALLPALVGYRYDAGGYYVVTARHRYDVHVEGRVPRGLPVASRDPLGAESQIEYDEHDLLAVRTIDAAGLATTATVDRRLLRPSELVDPNGNSVSVTFSAAGLVTGRFVRGKNGEGDADAPSVRLTYDLFAYAERRQPPSVRTVRRVHYDTDVGVPAADRDDEIVFVEYSDGFGRVLQTRSQAEDVIFGDPAFGGGMISADQSAPAGDSVGRARGAGEPDNVVVSGWQVYDNKGQVVRKYEPFFATGWTYGAPGDAELGQRSTTFYDPLGRVIRMVSPDGAEHRTVFGVPADLADPDRYVPTPWESYIYDANDNAGRTHGAKAAAYQDHWNTPTSAEVDSLGRTVRLVTRNGVDPANWFVTWSEYDMHGNIVAITDPLDRVAFRFVHDLMKRRWRVNGLDCGRRDTVFDARGGPVEYRDGKGALTLRAFDRLNRPIRLWARDDQAGPVTLRQRIEYGDGARPDQPATERDEARARNLLGRPLRHHDEAGLVTVRSVDIQGNVRESDRRVIADAPVLASYADAEADGWRVTPFRVDWTPATGQSPGDRDAELLETATYVTTVEYDALNRPTQHVFPTDEEGRRRVLRLGYNRSGALDHVRLDGTTYVQRIAYDAKGKRTLVAYGNGVLTRYAYDPRSFRLVRQRSEFATVKDLTYRPAGPVLQDHGYDYDLHGNVLVLRDRTPGSGIRGNPEALAVTDPRLRKLIGDGEALDRRFTYDQAYRLVSATGREHLAPPAGDPWIDAPRGVDVNQTQPYVERYRYDAVGGLLALVHAGTGGYTREFTVDSDTNRLSRMAVGATGYDYTYDGSGNQLRESTSRHFGWNHDDRMTSFATQVAGSEPSVHAQYLYDAAGQRVKKLVRRQGGAVAVTHYVDQLFEHHRWSGPSAGSNTYLHVMDDRHRLALVRVGDAHPDDRTPAVTFHLPDHLHSSNVVVDAAGGLAYREEFTPFGETAFGGFAGKRYRFTGRERDEESGLGYHEARYLAPYAGRWLSTDPVVSGGSTPYGYAAQNPMRWVDHDGEQPHVPTQVKSLVDAVADYYAHISQAALDSTVGMSPRSWFERARAGTLAGNVMREDLTLIFGKGKFEVPYSTGSLAEIDLSLKEIPVDIEFKLTPSATRSKQSIAFQKYAKENNRLLVFVYGNAEPEYFNYTNRKFTAKELAALESAAHKIQAKVSGLVRSASTSGGSASSTVAAERAAAAEAAEAGGRLSRGARAVKYASKALNVAGNVGVGLTVFYRSTMVGYNIRQGNWGEVAKETGKLAWELTPGPLAVESAKARERLADKIREQFKDKDFAEWAVGMSCLDSRPSCRQ